MPKEYKKVSVFLDTNILQSFFKFGKKDYVFLANLGIPKIYYDLVSFITENRLENHIEICISEVVFKEIRQHMINNFNSFCDTLTADVASYSKIAGDLLEYNYRIKLDKENYPEYVDGLITDFIDNPKNMCKYIPVSSKENLLDTLLDKSIRGVKPFAVQTIDGKSYKDAGFKDSIIAETIYSHCSADDRKGLFITNDSDFGQTFENVLNDANKFVKCSSIEQAIEFLKKYYETSVEERLKREFTENAYWHEYLLNSVEQEYDASVTNVTVDSVSQYEDNEYNINITMIVNETTYWFTVNFDAVANDIIDFQYHIEND